MKYLVIIRHNAFGQIFCDLANLCKTEEKVFPSRTIIVKNNNIDVLIAECEDIRLACEQLKRDTPSWFNIEVMEVNPVEV